MLMQSSAMHDTHTLLACPWHAAGDGFDVGYLVVRIDSGQLCIRILSIILH